MEEDKIEYFLLGKKGASTRDVPHSAFLPLTRYVQVTSDVRSTSDTRNELADESNEAVWQAQGLDGTTGMNLVSEGTSLLLQHLFPIKARAGTEHYICTRS